MIAHCVANASSKDRCIKCLMNYTFQIKRLNRQYHFKTSNTEKSWHFPERQTDITQRCSENLRNFSQLTTKNPAKGIPKRLKMQKSELAWFGGLPKFHIFQSIYISKHEKLTNTCTKKRVALPVPLVRRLRHQIGGRHVLIRGLRRRLEPGSLPCPGDELRWSRADPWSISDRWGGEGEGEEGEGELRVGWGQFRD